MKTTQMITIGGMMVMLLLAVAPACVADDSSANRMAVTNWIELKDALAEGSGTVVVDGDIHIVEDCEVKLSVGLRIRSGSTITVDEERLFIVNGDIENSGTMVNNGYTVINGNFQSPDGSAVINNYVWAGFVPQTNYTENGEYVIIAYYDYANDICTLSSVSAVYFNVPLDSSRIVTVTIEIMGGESSVSIPNSGFSPGELVTVIVTESENTSNVEGKLYSVKIAGVNPDTVLTMTLPSSSSDDRVYHVVNGVVREEIAIDSRSGGFVTFRVYHNSEYAVGTVSEADSYDEDSDRANHVVTINTGAGFNVSKTGTSTKAGTFVFNVTPRDGYEIKDVRATNGDIIRNGHEYILSNVTADTKIYVMATEVAKDTPKDDTVAYVATGAAVGAVITIGFVSAMVFVNKP